MQYKILPFIITECDEYSVVQNSKNTVIIKNSKIIDLFNWSDNNAIYEVSITQLKEIFGDRTNEAIEFMEKNHLVKNIKSMNMDFENITIVSNDKIFIDSMKFNSRGCEGVLKYELLPKILRKFEIKDSGNLYIFFLNPFNYKYFAELVSIVKQYNIVSRFGFYYNQNIFLSNYYKQEWFNPCPLCFFGNLESSLRGSSKALNTISFQALIDLIYQKNPKFEIQNNFTNYNILPFVNSVLEDINSIDNSHINDVKYIDFNRNIIRTDQTMHWELCDCYE